MKIKPILFSTPMVTAILNGTKTQTRRALKQQPERHHWEIFSHHKLNISTITTQNGLFFKFWDSIEKNQDQNITVKAKYNIGDIIWVRETWQITHFLHPSDENYGFIYKASENGLEWQNSDKNWKWKPSIFMPKNACRIFLKVTNVRVERLQKITQEDCISEGIENFWNDNTNVNAFRNYLATKKELKKNHWDHVADDALHSFKSLWQSINGVESWYENPFVFVYDFELTTQPKCFLQ